MKSSPLEDPTAQPTRSPWAREGMARNPTKGVADIIVMADDSDRAGRILAQLEQTVFAEARTCINPLKEGFSKILPPPYLVILDIQETAVIDPLMHIKQIKQVDPTITIVIISSDSNPELAQRALRAGASAYLTDEETTSMLPQALALVATGERFVSEDVMQGILHGMVDSVHNENRIPIEMLSDREMVIFQMIGHGKYLRDIAEELNVNIKTIATHCNNIRRKLQSRDNRHLTRLSQSWVAETQAHHT